MGDGRHRQDPGGHGRYVIAALGILIVLVLLATGGYALFSVLTTESTASPNASGRAARTSSPVTETGKPDSQSSEPPLRASAIRQRSAGSPSAKAAPRTGPATLALTITGERSYVSVRVPGGKTLLNRTLRRGDTARFLQPNLRVTVGRPSAVRVMIEGKPRGFIRTGVDTFTVSRSG